MAKGSCHMEFHFADGTKKDAMEFLGKASFEKVKVQDCEDYMFGEVLTEVIADEEKLKEFKAVGWERLIVSFTHKRKKRSDCFKVEILRTKIEMLEKMLKSNLVLARRFNFLVRFYLSNLGRDTKQLYYFYYLPIIQKDHRLF